MKKIFESIPKWCKVGFVTTVILYIVMMIISNILIESIDSNKISKYDTTIKKVEFVPYTSNGIERRYVKATVTYNDNDYEVTLPDDNYQMGDIIKLYYYNNSFFYSINNIDFSSIHIMNILIKTNSLIFLFFTIKIIIVIIKSILKK